MTESQFKDSTQILQKFCPAKAHSNNCCSGCIEKTLKLHAAKGSSFVRGNTSEEIALTCPFCNMGGSRTNILTEELLNSFPNNEDLVNYFKKRFENVFVNRNYNVRFCPHIGCFHKEVLGKSLKCPANFVECPEHGRQCMMCWKITRTEIRHICSKVPLSLFDQTDEFGRCPECLSVIIKNGGCNKMECRCGKEFPWDKNIIKKQAWVDDELAHKESLVRAKLDAEAQAKIERIERYMIMTRAF